MTNPARRYPLLIGIVFLAAFMPARGADASTFVCTAGDTACLIQAINDANTNGQVQNTIRLAAGTYTLTDVDNQTDGPNGLPSITSTLRIRVIGSGMACLERASTAPSFRLFHVASAGDLTLRGLTLRNGVASTSSGLLANSGGGLLNNGGVATIRDSVVADNHAAGSGGGLYSSGGTVTITNSAFVNNIGSTGAGLLNRGGTVIITESVFEQNDALGGGGLVNSDGFLRMRRSRVTENSGHIAGGVWAMAGFVAITETTFSGNVADGAGGIFVAIDAKVVVTNSSFHENLALGTGSGAGIFNLGTSFVRNSTFAGNILDSFTGSSTAIENRGHLSLVNSTLAGNVARGISSVFSTAVLLSFPNATTVLKNTIIVHDATQPLTQDCSGNIASRGNNLIGDLTGCTVNFQPGDLTGDGGLGTFTDDGTPGNGYFPLLKGSQAVDAGNDAFCPRRDQIGEQRRGQCDIGAIEFQPTKHHHHRWDDHDERDDAWSREQFDEGFDQPNGNTQTPEP
jgi:hypothetical protein